MVPVAAAALLTIGSSGTASTAAPDASRVIDRTLVCTTGIQGGVHVVDIAAQAGVKSPQRPGRWKLLAGFELTTQGSSEPGPEQWVLAMISAGRTEQGWGGTVSIGPGRCKATEAIPLASTGLEKQPVSQFGDLYECWVARRVLVRVRGSFQAPATLRRNTFGYLTAMGGMAREAKLAVRTLTGKPLVYAEAFESGKARLFLAGGPCHPD
jgi:hypothetical protein